MKHPKEMTSEELVAALPHADSFEKFAKEVKEEVKFRLPTCPIIQKHYKLIRGGVRTYYGKDIPKENAREICYLLLESEETELSNFVEFKNHKDMPEHIKELVEKFPHSVQVKPSIGKNKSYKEGGLENKEDFPWE